ncbi:MAG: von Willebrand factor type [Hydrocarboniphaga sp.]|uniref:vWA domain-containing protein n=1 Tax=Hydrocarboniphaga sp. TaxID=2033016 RepID=UPI0026247C05|nr:vWA domain-containing protein [Hydrocarboniphaga sp.]MDB5969203.1 von Willebrand factor type [Hydrocarboniphaga sp.]
MNASIGGLSFTDPWLLPALLLALLPLAFQGLRRFAYPSLAYVPVDWPSRLLQGGLRLLAASTLALLIIAAAGPYAGGGSVSHVGSGAQIVVVFDRSGSMSEPMASGWDDTRKGESKIVAARRILLDFMHQRRGDMFGMVAFGSTPIGVAPLSDDRPMAEAALKSAEARSMGFTAIGRALGMSLDYFRDRPYTAARMVLLVSDGGAEIPPADREILQTLFVNRRTSLIWLYTRGAREPSVITVGDGDGDGDAAHSSQSLSMHQFFSQLGVPYQVMEATSTADVQRAIDQIGKLTNLPTRYQEQLPRRDLATPLYSLALLMLALLAAAKLAELRTWSA